MKSPPGEIVWAKEVEEYTIIAYVKRSTIWIIHPEKEAIVYRYDEDELTMTEFERVANQVKSIKKF